VWRLQDVARDARPGTGSRRTDGPHEGAHKLLALYDRAQARDFVDVAALVERFGLGRRCELASARDSGFSRSVLVDMLASFRRFPLADGSTGLADRRSQHHQIVASSPSSALFARASDCLPASRQLIRAADLRRTREPPLRAPVGRRTKEIVSRFAAGAIRPRQVCVASEEAAGVSDHH
jgi:hypothetical protein